MTQEHELSDNDLLHLMLGGDEEALAQLYRRRPQHPLRPLRLGGGTVAHPPDDQSHDDARVGPVRRHHRG